MNDHGERSHPQLIRTEQDALAVWRQNYRHIAFEGVCAEDICEALQLDTTDLNVRTIGDEGYFRQVNKLYLRMVDIRNIAQKRSKRMDVSKYSETLHLAEPESYVQVTVLSLHYLAKLAAVRKEPVDIKAYIPFAEKHVPEILIGESQEKRYDAIAQAMNSLKGRLNSIDLDRFRNK